MSEDLEPAPEMEKFDKKHQWTLIRLIGRMTVFYAVLFASVVLALSLFPGLADKLPVGGMDYYANVPDVPVSEIGSILDESTRSTGLPNSWIGGSWWDKVQALLLAMFAAFVLMIPVSWVFKTIHEGHDYDHSIDETALILPAVVAGIVTVVQHSLALAFSLAGIMAGVRFRRALSDTFDTLFIFVAIGVGLATGVASIETAIAITVFFNYATVGICIFGDGLESKYIKQKKAARQDQKIKRQMKLQPPSDNSEVN